MRSGRHQTRHSMYTFHARLHRPYSKRKKTMSYKTCRSSRHQTRVSAVATPRPYTIRKAPAMNMDAPTFLGPPKLVYAIRRMMNTSDAFDDFQRMLIGDSPRVMDVAFDLGKPVVLHFDGVAPVPIQGTCIQHGMLDDVMNAVESEDHIVQATGRAGIHGTLHRVSMLYDFNGSVVGATLRLGRHLNMHDVLPDDLKTVIAMGKSVILFGPPGTGKTTLLRAISEYAGDYVPKRTVVVDASGELGGVGTNVLGQYTRRACVPPGSSMPETMMHAIRNHTPQVLVVDELVTPSDTAAAQTCSARGIQLVASAHAMSLETLITNPVFRDRLFGGIQHAAIGDTEAKMLGTKFVKERKCEPVFEAAYDCSTRTLYDCLVKRIDELL